MNYDAWKCFCMNCCKATGAKVKDGQGICLKCGHRGEMKSLFESNGQAHDYIDKFYTGIEPPHKLDRWEAAIAVFVVAVISTVSILIYEWVR